MGFDREKCGIELPRAAFGFWRAVGHVCIAIFAFGAAMDASRPVWTLGEYARAFLVSYLVVAVIFEAARFGRRRLFRG